VQTQLKERRILFSELWYLLKSYLAAEVAEWESLPESQHREMLLATGTSFIADQLPLRLNWLAGPIAQATTLRSFRLSSVVELMDLIAEPASESVREDIAQHNIVAQVARDLDPPVEFSAALNVWDVRVNPQTAHWAISSRLAAAQLRDVAAFTSLKEVYRDPDGHRFFQIVGDLEADNFETGKLTLEHLAHEHTAWLGA